MAALYPDDTDYFFYALDSSGSSHRFFQTYMDQVAFLNGEDTSDEDAQTDVEETDEQPYDIEPITEEDTDDGA
jgi:hypothetical protein